MPKKYYDLTKPGIIYGNLMTAAAGLLLASHVHIYTRLLLGALSGIALIIASACVFNNYLDRGIDKKMDRTKSRALASGDIPTRNAIIFATLLGFVGFIVLAKTTNPLTVVIGAVGYIDYVILYGYAKRHSSWGTLVGSVSGAMPVVAGYTAVTNRFDSGAVILFLILVCWQMPHFFAIALRRFDDYKRAGLPVLPVKKGFSVTKTRTLLYITSFMVACAMLTVMGYTGYIFLLVMAGLGVTWLRLGIINYRKKDDVAWGKRMFLFSLIIIMSLSVMLPLGALLP